VTELLSDKKELILDAAVKIFSEKGFHNAKVEEIASTAGIGKGTVYEYFRSKKELFQEIFLSFMEKNMQLIENEISNNLQPKEALIRIMEIQFNFVVKNKDIAKLMMNEHQAIDNDFKLKILELNKQKVDLVSNYVEKGIKQGVFRQVNSLLVAMILEGVIHALLSSSMCKESTVQKVTIEDIKSLLFDGLEKR